MNTYATDVRASLVRTGDQLNHSKARWSGWTVIGVRSEHGMVVLTLRDLTPVKHLADGTALHRTCTITRTPEEMVNITRIDQSLVLRYTVASEYGPEEGRILLALRDGTVTPDGQAILELVRRHPD